MSSQTLGVFTIVPMDHERNRANICGALDWDWMDHGYQGQDDDLDIILSNADIQKKQVFNNTYNLHVRRSKAAVHDGMERISNKYDMNNL